MYTTLVRSKTCLPLLSALFYLFYSNQRFPSRSSGWKFYQRIKGQLCVGPRWSRYLAKLPSRSWDRHHRLRSSSDHSLPELAQLSMDSPNLLKPKINYYMWSILRNFSYRLTQAENVCVGFFLKKNIIHITSAINVHIDLYIWLFLYYTVNLFLRNKFYFVHYYQIIGLLLGTSCQLSMF